MMIPKDTFPRDRNFPAVQIIKKRLGIAYTTESKERTVSDLTQILDFGAIAITMKTQQARLGIKNRIFVGVASFNVGAFGLACDHQDVSAAAGGNRFAEHSCREKPLVFELVRNVEHYNIKIACKREVLKTVVKDENVDGLLPLDASTFGKAIFAYAKRNPALQAMLHQLDFVACAARTAIPPAENSDTLPFREKFSREPQNHGRLAGATDSQIANANHLAAQTPRLQPTLLIKPGAHTNVTAIHNRKRPEQDSHQKRKIHPFSRAAPSRCRAISAMARSVAPRLLSTSLRAVSPIRAARSGLRMNSIQATPASSGLSP